MLLWITHQPLNDNREVFKISGTYPWSLVRYILSYIYNQKLSMSCYVYFVIVTICWADTKLNTNVKVGIIITRTLIWNNFTVFFPTIIAWNIILSDHKKSPFLSNDFVFGGVRVAHLFSFLCCIFCFFRLRLVSCTSDVARVSRLSILDCLFGSLWRLFHV